MKHAVLLLLLFGYTKLLFAQELVRFEVQCSAPYATYDFVLKLADSYPDNELKTVFAQSKYHTEAYRKQVTAFEQLRLDYTYAFTQYPQPLKARLQSRDMLEKNLATSQTVAEFKEKSLGLIPNEDLLALADILNSFLPIYQEVVMEPNKAALETQKNRLSHYVDTQQFARFFALGLTFYDAPWDNGTPFRLNLLPSLDQYNLGARAFFNVAVCETPLQLKDHASFFSVAMHEIYHIVYDNQSLAKKREVQQWFTNTASGNSQYALLLLNEVLATALGNGYVLEQLNGKTDSHEWYGNPYVSEMAKEIYPLLKQYLAAKRPLDEAFVQAYVKAYDVRFPHWGKELAHLFAYRYIIADSAADLRYFSRTYRQYSYNRLAAPFSASEIELLSTSPLTKVVVISTQHHQKMTLLKQTFPELKDKQLKHRGDVVQAFTLADQTRLFVINRHKLTVEQLMNQYFPRKVIE